MDKYIENRFGYLNEKSVDELVILREQIVEDMNYMLNVLENGQAFREQKSEINDDLKFDREKLEYVDFLIEKKNHKRTV